MDANVQLNDEKGDFALTQKKSDPVCGSGGCWKSDYSKKIEAGIVQYPDPDAQGLDSDVKTTLKHEE